MIKVYIYRPIRRVFFDGSPENNTLKAQEDNDAVRKAV